MLARRVKGYPRPAFLRELEIDARTRHVGEIASSIMREIGARGGFFKVSQHALVFA